MSEQSDDTTEPPTGSRPADERAPRGGGYYYDDATGYEVYEPETEMDDSLTEGETDGDEDTAKQAGRQAGRQAGGDAEEEVEQADRSQNSAGVGEHHLRPAHR